MVEYKYLMHIATPVYFWKRGTKRGLIVLLVSKSCAMLINQQFKELNWDVITKKIEGYLYR